MTIEHNNNGNNNAATPPVDDDFLTVGSKNRISRIVYRLLRVASDPYRRRYHQLTSSPPARRRQ